MTGIDDKVPTNGMPSKVESQSTSMGEFKVPVEKKIIEMSGWDQMKNTSTKLGVHKVQTSYLNDDYYEIIDHSLKLNIRKKSSDYDQARVKCNSKTDL